MYAPFFGLNKEPFSIAPDPRFLFMSDMHREALAHLLYGVSGGGGFVLLTGEIGAGKTTVCRAFLDQVPAHCAVAYIFNPKLTVVELLQTICEEFGVETPAALSGSRAQAPSVKDYVDALNGYLLAAHAAGCHTVLIIDEAQSLAADVLEQLRLLTNLETAEKKLLQIVLIGQPELRDLLARPELEQMAQRVIARYHLPALSATETGQYIQHRLAVAGPAGARQPFDSRAVARVHALTGGVPRRINLLCDRALLGAYAHGQHRVNAEIVDQAAREVFGASRVAAVPRSRWRAWALGATAAALALGVAAGWVWRSEISARLAGPVAQPQGLAAASAAASGSGPQPTARTMPAAAPGPASAGAVAGPETPLAEPAAVLASAWRDEAAAWRGLALHWKVTLPEGEPCAQALAAGLVCYRASSGLGVLRKVARPAVLMLRDAQGQLAYVTLLGVGATGATLAAGDKTWRLSLPALASVWRGDFATYWRAPPGWRPGPDAADHPATTAWLQQRLALAGVSGAQGAAGASASGASLRDQVRTFQVANGLQADGRAGPLTLMLLGRVDEPGLLQDR
jgi:general secretion pathway protein A